MSNYTGSYHDLMEVECKMNKKTLKCPECAGPHPASECDSEQPDQGFSFLNDKEKEKPDMINHPSHYTKGIEVLDYTESWGMNPNQYASIKYITRYPHKYPNNLDKQIEDLQKAVFYVNREIGILQRKKNEYQKLNDPSLLK